MKQIESHVLIVDDNNLNVQVLGNILNVFNFNISISNSGKKALNFLNNYEVDLILLNVVMPEMDGFEVLSTIKKNQEFVDIPVIVLTASNNMEDKVKGFKCGAVDFIAMPFIREEILTKVKVHLELAHSLKKLKKKQQLMI